MAIRYKKHSPNATYWANHESTAEEVWEFITDGVVRSDSFVSEVLRGVPTDDMVALLLSKFDTYCSPDKLTLEELRLAAAYIRILTLFTRTVSERSKTVPMELFLAYRIKIFNYIKALNDNSKDTYRMTANSVSSSLAGLLSDLRRYSGDLWLKLPENILEDDSTKEIYNFSGLASRLTFQGISAPWNLWLYVKGAISKLKLDCFLRTYGVACYYSPRELESAKPSEKLVTLYKRTVGCQREFYLRTMFRTMDLRRMQLFQCR